MCMCVCGVEGEGRGAVCSTVESPPSSAGLIGKQSGSLEEEAILFLELEPGTSSPPRPLTFPRLGMCTHTHIHPQLKHSMSWCPGQSFF